MVLGTLGSTLNDELNRLANGGTYRDMDDMVDEALAAKQWANRENISPYSTDTVGVLNEIAGLGLDKKNWLDFNGICNYIGGTSGLPAAAALRQIYPTTDLLTGVASFYTDAAYPLGSSNSGYVYLNGSAGNYISTPDAAALDIVGDIDLRAYIAPDTWIPAAASTIISKWLSTGNQRSFRLQITTTGLLSLAWTSDGATGTLIQVNSTVATGLLNTQVKWVRATLDVSNGSGGYDVAFYTSDDGSSWTQLGTTVTNAGTASIYSGTANVEIGSLITGTTENLASKVFRAQVLNGIGGTTVLDANCSVVISQSQTSFAATTGQTMTIAKTSEQVNILTNLGTAGALLPTTVGSSLAADSNDAKFLDHTGTNYVYTPGVASNNLSIPSSAALNITGDMDLRAYVASDNWANGATFQDVISKWDTTANTRQYALVVDTLGKLQLIYSTDGITGVTSATSSVAVPFTNGVANWIRATRAQAAGEIKFFTGTDGTNWTQLGTTITGVTTSNFFTSSTSVMLGNNPTNSRMLIGKLFRAQIYSDITETTKVLDVDTSVITAGSATSFTAVTGQTVTINRSTSGRKSVAVTQPTWLFGTDDYMEVNNRYMAHSTSDENYVYLSGASGNYMSVADNPPLDIAGDLDIQIRVALDDWTPAAVSCLLSKSNATGNQRSYFLGITTGGILQLTTSPDGSTLLTRSCTVATSITDGTVKWVRATIDVDNGASGNDVKFFTSDNGTTWTQLGATVTSAGTTSIFNSTTPVEIGTRTNGTIEISKGAFYRAIIKNGIDGTTVLDANAAVITLPSQTTFTDSSSNAYTVTINKSGVGTFVSTGNYLYLPGVQGNVATAPDSAALDITGDIDLRVKVALDDWTPAATNVILSKRGTAVDNISYGMQIDTNGRITFFGSNTGTDFGVLASSTVSPTIADGATKWVRATLDVDNGAGGKDFAFYTSDDGTTWTQLGTTVTIAGTTSLFSGNAVLSVGGTSTISSGISRGKFFRAQVLSGIGGTVAFDANFEGSITSLNQASFTESSTNAATVTINRSGSAFRSAGVIDAGYLYPGATNTFSNSTIDYLNFGATDSFTVLVAVRQWNTPGAYRRYIAKQMAGINNAWGLMPDNVSFRVWSAIRDSGAEVNGGVVAFTQGDLSTLSMVTNRTTETLTSYSGATAGTPTSTVGKGSLTNPATMFIGTTPAGAPQDFEFIGAAVFRTALTATQIRQISNYFANREVYL